MNDELPQGWIPVQIAELCDVVKEKGREGIAPYLEIGNVDINSKSYAFADKKSVKGCRKAKRYDVLISKVRPTRGAITWIREEDLQISSAFAVLRNKGALVKQYLWLYLAWNQDYFNHLGERCTGTMYPTTSDDAIVAFDLPLAPLNEQRRIVAKLDKLLVKVDACEKRLAKIPVILKRFRQSVLTAACSGRLTADWREKNPDVEWIESLFKKIQEIRADDYSKKSLQARKDGAKKPKKPTNLDQNIECSHIDEYEEIPESWKYIPLGLISANEPDSIVDGPFGSSVNVKTDYIAFGVPVVRINNVRPFRFVNENLKYVSQEKFDELSRHKIIAGDILLAKVGATIGDCCLYPDGLPMALLSTTGSCRISVDKAIVEKTFACIVINSLKSHLKWISSEVAQPFLNMDAIKGLPICVPPLLEQQEIVRRVEALFALADQIEARCMKAKAYVDKLTQSILAKAFRGELVPQDSNDEPASMLLEKIRAAREKQEPKSRDKGKKKTNGHS